MKILSGLLNKLQRKTIFRNLFYTRSSVLKKKDLICISTYEQNLFNNGKNGVKRMTSAKKDRLQIKFRTFFFQCYFFLPDPFSVPLTLR